MHLTDRLRRWWGEHLARRLLVTTIVTTVTFLVLLGVLAFQTGQASLRHEVNRRNSQLAPLVAADVRAQFDDIWGNVRLLVYELEPSPDLLPLHVRALMGFRRAAPLTYRALYLFDGEGHLLAHLADTLEDLMAIEDVAEVIDRPPIPLDDGVTAACEAAQAGGLFISDVHIVGADRTPVVYMGIPAAGALTQPREIVVAEIDLRDIWRRIDEIQIGRTGRAFVVSRGGTIIAHSDRAYIGQPLAEELARVLAGYEGQVEYTDPVGGARLLASYSPVGGQSGWGVVMEQERAEALAPVNRIAFVALTVVWVAAGMATAVSAMIARGVTRPILHLVDVTRTIARTGDLGQEVAVESADEVGQLAATFNQMMASRRRVEEEARRLLAQQMAVNQLALALGETRDLDRVYSTIYEHIRAMVDAWGFIVSFYDEETRLIEARYAVHKGVSVDVAGIPPIPLAEPGRGTQSRVIHTGEPLYTPDHRQALETSRSEYVVEQDGAVRVGPPPEEEEATRSALYTPIKSEGRAIGVMQLQSPRLDAYTPEDVDLLAAMANVAAVAIQNAQLHEAILSELAERRRAEDQLRRQTAILSTLLNSPQETVALLDVSGTVLAINLSGAHRFGMSPEEMAGQNIYALIPEPVSGERKRIIADAMRTGQPAHFEDQRQGMHFMNGVYPVNDPQSGELLGVTIFAVDITERVRSEMERRRAEEALRESEGLLRIMAENYPNSYISIIERDLTVGFTSGQEFKKQGLDPNDFVGLTLEQVFGEHTSLVKENYLEAFGGAETQFELFTNNQHHLYRVVPLVNPDGQIGRILAVVENITERKRAEAQIVESQAELQRLLAEADQSRRALLRVVEDQKRAEEEIRRLNEELEQRVADRTAQLARRNRELSVLYTISRATAESLDLEKTLNNAFEATLEALSVEAGGIYLLESDGETMTLRVHRGHSDEFVESVQRLKVGEGIFGKAVVEKRPIVLDVSEYPTQRLSPLVVREGFQTMASIPLLSAGQAVGALNLGTRRMRAFPPEELELLTAIGQQLGSAVQNARLYGALRQGAAQLEAANQELEAFAYSVSHDLRAPLRAMDGFSATLLSQYQDQLDEQGRHYLDRVRAASQRMGDLINDLLDLSRVTRAALTRQPVDLSALAREIAAELQAQDPQRQVEIVIAEGLAAEGDAHLLRIALENMLGNAWKFTGKREQARIEAGCLPHPVPPPHPSASPLDSLGGRLRAGAGEGREGGIFFVRDNGAGFDMAYAGKLFAPFQRLHGVHEFPGTGIGLATVQRIVARHGGRVWAEAEVDQGATFYFTLGGV